MRFWEHIARRLRGKGRLEQQLALSRAYKSVFYGNPDRQQQQIVLADLGARCGWNQITHPKYASDREVWFAEGKRAAFGEIFAHLSLSYEDVEALANAVRHEVVTFNEDA